MGVLVVSVGHGWTNEKYTQMRVTQENQGRTNNEENTLTAFILAKQGEYHLRLMQTQ